MHKAKSPYFSTMESCGYDPTDHPYLNAPSDEEQEAYEEFQEQYEQWMNSLTGIAAALIRYLDVQGIDSDKLALEWLQSTMEDRDIERNIIEMERKEYDCTINVRKSCVKAVSNARKQIAEEREDRRVALQIEQFNTIYGSGA